MRRNGIDNAYEQLKELTRGQNINQATLHNFIQQLDLPNIVKQQLQGLTPQNYTGNAEDQAKLVLKNNKDIKARSENEKT